MARCDGSFCGCDCHSGGGEDLLADAQREREELVTVIRTQKEAFAALEADVKGLRSAIEAAAQGLLPLLIGWQETGKIVAVRNALLASLGEGATNG